MKTKLQSYFGKELLKYGSEASVLK